MAKKFRCTVCGYIHEGNEAPATCPLCKVPADKFVEIEEQSENLEFATEHKLGDGLGADAELMKGKRILIVDDVISTGESLRAIETLVERAGGIICGKMTILAEGDATERDDIIYLEKLPLFFK